MTNTRELEERWRMWPADKQLDELIAARRGAWLRLAILMAGSRGDGEDLLQDSLIALAGAWSRLDRRGLNAYMRRTIVNRAIDRTRARRETPVGAVPETVIEDPVLRYEEDQAFFEHLATLPAAQRAAMVCRYYLDLSEADTANLLGCARTTVRSHIHRAVLALRAADEQDHLRGRRR